VYGIREDVKREKGEGKNQKHLNNNDRGKKRKGKNRWKGEWESRLKQTKGEW